MSNCDFYAVGNDLVNILEFTFTNLDCRVFELSSGFDEQLCEFKSLEELKEKYDIGKCINRTSSVNLQLWPVKASNSVVIDKIDLNPKKCNGAKFRYQITGWGLIQLYIGGISKLGIVHSHTNHNSEKRAKKLASINPELTGTPSDWDWKEVSRVSNKLNRYITKCSVSKINSRPVLQEAATKIKGGNIAL